MDEPVAVVGEIRGARALVEAEGISCARCLSGRGCGAGLFAGRRRSVSLVVQLAAGLEPEPGDRVVLRIADGGLFRGVLLLYGLPLAGMVTGGVIPFLAGAAETWSVVASAAGMVAGILAGSRLAARDRCLSRLQPIACGYADSGDRRRA